MDKIILNIYKRKRILRALCVLLLTYLTFFIAGYLFLGMPFMLIFPSSFIRLDPPSFLYELETLLSDIDLPAFFLNLKPLWSDITCNAALVAAAADLIGTYDRDFRKLDSIMFRNCDFTRYMQLLKTGLFSCSAKGPMSAMIRKAIQTRYVNALIYEGDLTAAETYLNESWRGNKGKTYFNLKKAVLSISERTFSFPRQTFSSDDYGLKDEIFYKCDMLFSQEKYRQAIKVLAKFTAGNRFEDVLRHFYMGKAYLKTGDTGAAEKHLATVIKFGGTLSEKDEAELLCRENFAESIDINKGYRIKAPAFTVRPASVIILLIAFAFVLITLPENTKDETVLRTPIPAEADVSISTAMQYEFFGDRVFFTDYVLNEEGETSYTSISLGGRYDLLAASEDDTLEDAKDLNVRDVILLDAYGKYLYVMHEHNKFAIVDMEEETLVEDVSLYETLDDVVNFSPHIYDMYGYETGAYIAIENFEKPALMILFADNKGNVRPVFTLNDIAGSIEGLIVKDGMLYFCASISSDPQMSGLYRLDISTGNYERINDKKFPGFELHNVIRVIWKDYYIQPIPDYQLYLAPLDGGEGRIIDIGIFYHDMVLKGDYLYTGDLTNLYRYNLETDVYEVALEGEKPYRGYMTIRDDKIYFGYQGPLGASDKDPFIYYDDLSQYKWGPVPW